MTNSNDTSKAFQYAISLCDKWRHEFVTPEHVLYAIAEQEPFVPPLPSWTHEPFRRSCALS